MKSIGWIGVAALIAMFLVPLAATPAQGADFTVSPAAVCDGDTVTFAPLVGASLDSVRWVFDTSGTAFDSVHVADTAKKVFSFTGDNAWKVRVIMRPFIGGASSPNNDSTVNKATAVTVATRVRAVTDGASVDENDSVWVSVFDNDSLFGVQIDTSALVVLTPPASFGPYNGTVTVDLDTLSANYGTIKYVPDPNYHGTDVFVYRVTNQCGDTDTATVAITVTSDGIPAIAAASFGTLGDVGCGACDTLGTWSVGDSFQVWVQVPPWDVSELTAGFPKVFLPGLGGSPTGDQMVMEDTTAGGDSTKFWWVNDSTWHKIPAGDLDMDSGFYDIKVQINGPSGTHDTLLHVLKPIDNRLPQIVNTPVWDLYYDANGDGIAAAGDTMHFFLDLSNNPFEEICAVTFTLWNWPDTGSSVPLAMNDPFEDGKYELYYAVPVGSPTTGIDTTAGPTHNIQIKVTDNACNLDSVGASYSGAIDNRSPDLSTIFDTTFVRLADADSNNCLGIGDQIQFSFKDTTNTDIVGYWADMFGWTAWFNDSTAMGYGVADSTDSSHIHVTIPSMGGNQWGMPWTLAPYPLKQAIDTASATDLFIWIFAEDDAGNKDSAKIVWTGTNPITPSVDLTAPNPITVDSCVNSANAQGERVVTLYWSNQSPDAGRFRVFWDAGTGTMMLNEGDTLAGYYFPADSNWSSDGTVELSWCEDYQFTVWTVDDCGNPEMVHPDTVFFCKGRRPAPVTDLTCASLDSNVIELTWTAGDTTGAAPPDSFIVFMGRDGTINYDNPVAAIHADSIGDYVWTTADAGLTLEEKGQYNFTVWTKDSCGNWEETHPDSTDCLSDAGPARVCVFQPDTLDCHSQNMHVYVCPLDSIDNDVISVIAKGRVKDTGNGDPGPWMALGAAGQNDQDVCFDISLSSSTLNSMVGTDTTKTIELIFVTTDEAGRSPTDSAAYVAAGQCANGPFTFDWSTMVPTATIVSIDGDSTRVYQPFCDVQGWEVSPTPGHTVRTRVTSGNPPYTIEVQADDDGNTGENDEMAYVGNVYATDTTFTLDLTGWSNGIGTVTVTWTDLCGNTTAAEVNVCVPDSLGPCAEVTYPVDGKCIRRSRSTLDPVRNISVTIDPLGNCIDPYDVWKIDFQWAKTCCIGTIDSLLRVCDTTFGTGDTTSICDTFPNGAVGVNIDSIVCVDTTLGGLVIRCFDSTIQVSCDTAVWSLIGEVVPGEQGGSGSVYSTDWLNAEDLAWITESGTNIYIRAEVFDNQGNKFTTECVQVCIDIDTPPLCISSPDLCFKGDTASITGTIDVFADLDRSLGNVDDIDEITLWYKKSSDADRIENWDLVGVMTPATSSGMWRTSLNTASLTNGVTYDFRVIAKTIWGTYSYDLNGDGDFDSGTFDANACDMTTWLVDRSAPQVAVDTVWTDINGEEIVQPNVSCTLSDPRGWVWTQFGQPFTVQPSIYPLTDTSDVTKIRWTLIDGACALCACDFEGQGEGQPLGSSLTDSGCDRKVLYEATGDNIDWKVTLDPTRAPFVVQQDGFQAHVLLVEVWDACGNKSEDCVTVYMLDIDTTDAIVVDPMNDAVFCQDETNDGGGILFTARTLMNEKFKKAVFYYRPQGGSTWLPIDSVESTGQGTTDDLTVMWYPHALGLDNGAYEITVVAEDYAGNRSVAGKYITTVHLSCAAPTVALTPPAADFLGCEFELEATATSGDPANPITQVCFYYQLATGTSVVQIGCDNESTGDTYNYAWDPSAALSDGMYYLYATATNKAGVTVTSDKILLKADVTAPRTEVIEVNGDGSNGGSNDPTTVVAGSTVDVYAYARDDQSPNGYGAEDNCGVDSVIVYVTDTNGKVVYGKLMTVDPNIDSLYMAMWPTTGLSNGQYRVWTKVTDCACNDASWTYWYVDIVNPVPTGTIAVDQAIMVCDTMAVASDSVDINLTPATDADIASVKIFWSPATSSDVYDQYTNPSPNSGTLAWDTTLGKWKPTVNFGTAGLSEGLYRVRAVITSSTGAVSNDFNSDGKFDDFTFDPNAHSNQMWLKVDRSVSPFTVDVNSGDLTIQSGTDVTVTVSPVTPGDECDYSQVCYGVVARNGNAGIDSCLADRTYSFDPIDSGLVNMNHGFWNGPVTVTVTDPLGNDTTWTDVNDLYILSDEAMVVSPGWGDYVSGSSATVTGRKWSSSSISEMTFYYGGATGGGTPFDTVSATGDDFVATWDLSSVPEGETYIWGSTTAGETRRVRVIVAQTPTHIVFDTARTDKSLRTVGNETYMFVGGLTDLCLFRDSISSINTVGVDKVAFYYRKGDAPGVPDQPSADLGWVKIGEDEYGSLCVDWFTDSISIEGCADGLYSVAAWVYDKAGNVNHSNILQLMVDNTKPYSEIVDIDGDETFSDCHEVVLEGNDTQVKFTAVAIDDRSCAGSEPQFNAGAKYLQFFVGDQCNAGADTSAVDIVWVIDASGSMGDDQAQIAAQANTFFTALGNLDFRLGVMAYTDAYNPIATDGTYLTGGASVGQFTANQAIFSTMVTSVGDQGSGTENGLTALTNALNWYPWRTGAKRVLVLVTDENADDIGQFNSLVPNLINSGAQIHTVMNFGDSTGYSTLAPSTNGLTLSITSSWGANLTALAAQIAVGGGTGGDVGIIWGKQIDLTDGDQYPDNPFAYWDPTGVPTGTYCAWTVVIDEVGNADTSMIRQICIKDVTPPVGMIAGFGFGKSCCDSSYTIYGRSCATDIDHVQFQYRETGSTVETDWTGIGLSQRVNRDSTVWMTTWNPCLLSGDYDIRMVPTDKSGNENFDIQPILKVTIADCMVTPDAGPSDPPMMVGFEDKTFENLGLVDVKNAQDIACHTMIAVYADLDNGLTVEKVHLWQDQGDASHYMGSFDDSSILGGGTGWFWAAYNVGLKTYMTRGNLTVYHVDADVSFPGTVTDDMLGAKVSIDPGALSADNGVVLFPARFPRLSLAQQHFQAWANTYGNATAIRLTAPVESFNTGKYAEITISYDTAAVAEAGLTSSDLAPAWWDGDKWNITDSMIAGGEIGNGTATFLTKNLLGVYAVVSSGRDCNSGALTVSIQPFSGGYASAKPTFHATVKSNIENGNGNPDINPNAITVTLDGTTIYSNGTADNDWSVNWDNTSGDLVVRWAGRSTAQAMTGGSHTITVLAFNKTGYCRSDSYTFDVDASEPDVYVKTSYVCTNPCFWFTVNDMGSGVNWDSVYVDVYDVTGSEFPVVPADKLIHTESPDAWERVGDTVKFCLTDDIVDGRRLRIVIYNGKRTLINSNEVVQTYWKYDYDFDGVPDMAGNHTEIVEEDFTVDAGQCSGPSGVNMVVELAPGSHNPFDPYAGQTISFSLNGFSKGGATVSVRVFDLTGEPVASLTPSGGGVVVWDGRTSRGELVAQGVYLIHFQRSGGTVTGASNSQALKVVVKRAD